MNIWFTSDLHFNHANILEYCNRPAADLDDMNEMLIERFNERVQDEDTVYVLGDVCMGQMVQTLPMCGRLNGDKHLILGNHDRPFPTNKKSAEWFHEYSQYFKTINIHGQIRIADHVVEMSHFPYEMEDRDKERYNVQKLIPFYPQDDGRWLLHGHVHSKLKSVGERQIHVGVDAWDYRPAHIDEIADLIKDT